jgi:hypothetical protein
MNSYCDLKTLKSRPYLNIEEDSEFDLEIRAFMESTARVVDEHCGKYFHTWEGTHYFRGSKSPLYLPEDVLSITTIKTDEDGDGTFENNLTANTDYYLHPLNDSPRGFPKTKIEINPNGSYGGFAPGIIRGVEIVGVFGYGNGLSATPYATSGATLNEALDASETEVTTTDTDFELSIGQTIRIDSEQMYIENYINSELTVKRGVNGTTAATHSNGAAISIYEYPEPVVKACLMHCSNSYRKAGSDSEGVYGTTETGAAFFKKSLDPDIREMLHDYRRVRI